MPKPGLHEERDQTACPPISDALDTDRSEARPFMVKASLERGVACESR